MCPARILVADDHDIVRRGILSLIQDHAGWKVVAEAKDGRDAVAKALELKPDLAVLDVSMPSLNGLDATRQMLKANGKLRVLVLTMHESEQLMEDVLRAGARGYILKADAGRDLVLAMEALLAGQPFFTKKAAQLVLEGFNGRRPAATRQELTAREREIVQLLAEGKSTKEVATVLGISVKTAETHRTNLMRKLDCHAVAEVVRYAVRNHLVQA